MNKKKQAALNKHRRKKKKLEAKRAQEKLQPKK